MGIADTLTIFMDSFFLELPGASRAVGLPFGWDSLPATAA
jgi:hypothetical protein